MESSHADHVKPKLLKDVDIAQQQKYARRSEHGTVGLHGHGQNGQQDTPGAIYIQESEGSLYVKQAVASSYLSPNHEGNQDSIS